MRVRLPAIIASAARIGVLVPALLIVQANSARAQETSAPTDFTLRGSDAADEDTLFQDSGEANNGDTDDATGRRARAAPPPPPGQPYPTPDAPIGPPPFGPRPDEPIGPPLAGPPSPPQPEPRQRRATPKPQLDGRRLIRRVVEEEEAEDPYAQVGVRLGTFVLRPTLDLGAIASDNPDGDEQQSWEAGGLVAPTLNLQSDWDRHAVELDLRGTASFYDDHANDDREAEAKFTGRYDISSDTEVNVEAGYLYTLESFTDPDTPSAAVERPAEQNYNAALGVTQRFNRLGMSLRGSFERETYEDVTTASGATISQEDRNNNDYALTGRASYLISPALEPFVEARLGTTRYDESTDAAGYRRDSRWGELTGGVIVNLSPKLAGEIGVGYRHENYDDPRFEDLNAPLATAALLWSPRRLTNVRLDIATTTEGTTIEGASGSVIHSADLTLERRMRHNLFAEAGLGLDYRDYHGVDLTETTWTAFGGLVYDLNRYAALVGRYTYERKILDPGDTVETNTVSVRLRLKR
ncbi:outer membrane beta-barrel protein [Afifella sp. H1R]|uniref:outer membrane beta-barrel protein n=1 Tax=Afifella sp. H1R TaxID=2908841 RepID=UPI001F41BDD2|nr:outer membrane beta-barrel protein [Afifella sp. H1R]MCF1505324.1 outer membrane beta-barrel protein [Afifella sp. H1R]